MADGDKIETLRFDTICDGKIYPIDLRILPAPGGKEDPHFRQKIFDRKFNETRNICYDVVGDAGQYINVFSQPKQNFQVLGQLKDDYYFHKIITQRKNTIIEITTEKIKLSFLSLKWNKINGNDWLKHENFVYKMKKNLILIKKQHDEKEDDKDIEEKFTFGIKRRRDSVGKYYLDILIFGLSTDYSEQNGLIGRIGNNDISVYPPVQSENDERRTVVINGITTIGYRKVRDGISCILIDVNYLLSPFKLKDYVFNI